MVMLGWITLLTALVRDISLTGTLPFASRLYSNPFLWVQIPVVIITNKKSPCKRSFFLLVFLLRKARIDMLANFASVTCYVIIVSLAYAAHNNNFATYHQ